MAKVPSYQPEALLLAPWVNASSGCLAGCLRRKKKNSTIPVDNIFFLNKRLKWDSSSQYFEFTILIILSLPFPTFSFVRLA
jgi:hypothetical protein